MTGSEMILLDKCVCGRLRVAIADGRMYFACGSYTDGIRGHRSAKCVLFERDALNRAENKPASQPQTLDKG